MKTDGDLCEVGNELNSGKEGSYESVDFSTGKISRILSETAEALEKFIWAFRTLSFVNIRWCVDFCPFGSRSGVMCVETHLYLAPSVFKKTVYLAEIV